MSDDPLADPSPPHPTSSRPVTPGDAPDGAPAAGETGAAPRTWLERFTELAARQREKLTAAEKLLAELEEAGAERE